MMITYSAVSMSPGYSNKTRHRTLPDKDFTLRAVFTESLTITKPPGRRIRSTSSIKSITFTLKEPKVMRTI
ncbi:hypothetical protein Mapa_003876 [Marchantia paleacea]|nr:hypothetical protein Mapa_003876 [Marchantia paleacea]